jgi:hypothetical protein
MLKKILYTIFILILLLQVYPYDLPEVSFDKEKDFLANTEMPKEIENIFRNSCYDCHSNQTVYPWYSFVSPVKYLVGYDIEEGRKELNLSNWTDFSDIKKIRVLNEIVETIETDEMPYPVYLITHRDARLSNSQKENLFQWVEQYSENLFE